MNDDILNDNVNYLEKISELEKILKKEQAKENENIENEEFNQKINAMKSEQQEEINKLNQKISELKPNITNNIKNISLTKIQKDILKKLNDYYEERNKNIEEKMSTICSKLMQEKCNSLDNCLNKGNEITQNINRIKKDLNNKEIVNNNEGEDNKLNNNNENKYKESNKNIDDLKNKKSNDLISNNNNDNNKDVNSNDKNNKDATLSNKNVRNSYQKRIIKKSRKDIQGNNNYDEENKINKFNQNNFNQNKINDDEPKDGQKKGTKGKDNKNEETNNDEVNVAEEGEDGQIGINKINNMNISKNKLKTDAYRKTNNNINTAGGFKNSLKKITDQAKPLIYNEEIRELPQPQDQQNDQLLKMKYKTAVVKPRKLYTSMKKFFFNDFEQKYIKVQKITDFEKEEIEKEIINEMRNGDSNLKKYCLNYIETNVLKFFKKKDLDDNTRDILKYNVETISQCCGMGKNYYINDFYPEMKRKKEFDRNKSEEALKKFRMEFKIKKEDYSDEGIIKRLEENNLDIFKTFQKIFG
jgi:hypothetical protein